MSRAVCPLIILSQKSGRNGIKKSRMKKSNQIRQQQPSKLRLHIHRSSYLTKNIFRDRIGNVRIQSAGRGISQLEMRG
jgi:hypothetical protein